MKKTSQSAGFELFAFTWALAGLFHQFSFSDWRWYDLKGLLLFGAILSVLYKPSSWQRFALFVLVDWISVALTFPTHPNHIVFSWIVDGTLLTSLVLVAFKQKGITQGDLSARWYEAFAPWVRISVCMLYAFTFFHKLNTSYFDMDWSCAVRMHVEINDRITVLPGARWAEYLSIYGSLVIELLIPALLLFRRTRVAGIILGLLFHALLALHPHPGLFSFSATMMALFTAFLPLSIADVLTPKGEVLKVGRWGLFLMGAMMLVWGSRKLLPADGLLEAWVTQNWKVGLVGYYIYLTIGLAAFTRAVRIGDNETQSPVGSWRQYPLLILFTLLVFVNGFGPYLGLRTQTSFSMFSNLHTENGVSNHFFVPSGIQLTNWQYDLVEIIDSNNIRLNEARDSGLLVVYQELRRIRSVAGNNFWVSFRRNGVIETFDMMRPETFGAIPKQNALIKRYLHFRPVERDFIHVRCKH